MNKRGFTLIELIVSISIMGILLVLALPQIDNLRSRYKDEKYRMYEKSVERAAKLYMDSNAEEEFDANTSGCITLGYNQLKGANLLKDFQDSDIDCSDDSDTYVNVTKIGNEYGYSTNIVCRKKDTNEPIYQHAAENGECGWSLVDEEGPELSVSPLSFDYTNAKNAPKIKVIIQDSGLGFKIGSSFSLRYQWVKKDQSVDENNWKNLKISKLSDTKNSRPSEFTAVIPSYPTDTGDYYLAFSNDPNNGVEDVVGNSLNIPNIQTTLNLQGTENQEYYKFDNDKPTCSIKVGAGYQLASGWYSVDVGLSLIMESNDVGTGVAGYNFSQEKTPATLNNNPIISFKNKGSYTVYGYVKDNAGNIGTCSETYNIGDANVPYIPNCNLYQWSANDYKTYIQNGSGPTSAGSRGLYPSSLSSEKNGWSLYPVLVIPTKKGTNAVSYYQVKVTGASTNVNNLNFTFRNIIANGTSYVQCRACNNAGCSAYSASQAVKVDSVAPKCSVGVYSENALGQFVNKVSGWTNKEVKVKAVCSDSLSGCKNSQSTSISSTTLYSPRINSNTNAQKHATSNNSVLKIHDIAGNETTCSSVKVQVDKTAPTCKTKKTNTGKSTGVTATFTCSDKGGSGVKSCTTKKTGLKASHDYTISDNAGNTGTCHVDVTASCSSYSTCVHSDCGTSKSCKETTTCKQYGCKDSSGKYFSIISASQKSNYSDRYCYNNGGSGGWSCYKFEQICTTVTNKCATAACGCKSGTYK